MDEDRRNEYEYEIVSQLVRTLMIDSEEKFVRSREEVLERLGDMLCPQICPGDLKVLVKDHYDRWIRFWSVQSVPVYVDGKVDHYEEVSMFTSE